MKLRLLALVALFTVAGCSLLGLSDASSSDEITLPLRVHVVKSEIYDLNAAAVVKDGAIRDRLVHINRIFDAAGIQFELESIRRPRPADAGPFKRAAKGERKQPALTALVAPRDLVSPKGLDLYVLRDLSAVDKGGAYRCSVAGNGTGPGAAFIAARTPNDRAQALRKWAHELGHALGLRHVPCEPEWAENLMMSGRCDHAKASRVALVTNQISLSRAQARKGHSVACGKGAKD